jgi:hypothetical protein
MNDPDFRFNIDVLRTIKNRVALGDAAWEIAGRVGCDMRTLDTICSAHGVELKIETDCMVMSKVGLEENRARAFAREAARRNMSPQQLMSMCLDLIAKDRMFAAVLD